MSTRHARSTSVTHVSLRGRANVTNARQDSSSATSTTARMRSAWTNIACRVIHTARPSAIDASKISSSTRRQGTASLHLVTWSTVSRASRSRPSAITASLATLWTRGRVNALSTSHATSLGARLAKTQQCAISATEASGSIVL